MAIFLIAHCVDRLESLLKYFLKREGLNVFVSDHVSEISQIVMERNSFCIVRQIDSKGTSDQERLKKLRKEFPSVKVFGVIKNDMSDELEEYYNKCGADRIYTYPCDWNETIKEVIDLTVQSRNKE